MTDDGFVFPFMYWVGMDTDPKTTPEALAEFNRFYSTVHVNEVVAAHPGFVRSTRYELAEPDPRGDPHVGPRWLAVYDMVDEAAAVRYVKDDARPWLHRQKYSPWPSARRKAKTVWRMIWRQLAASGSSGEPPDSIFIVGMNVPPDTSDEELAAFNTFYTDTHVPEVIARGGYARGTRFELYRAFAHPEPGSPRFCAVYEAPADRTLPAERAPMSSGPPAWEAHDTLWRLVYRRIPSPD